MTRIDGITAVLAIPAVQEDGALRDARPGETVLDDYVRELEDRFAAFSARAGRTPSPLDEVWSELLGQPARVDRADFSIYEKKGLVYPAILFAPSVITGPDGAPLVDAITDSFREEGARTRLAELIGTRLGVEWVSIFTTFGGTG
jgi:hypothetical protein